MASAPRHALSGPAKRESSSLNLAASSADTTPGVSTSTTCVSPLVHSVHAPATLVVCRRCETGHPGKPVARFNRNNFSLSFSLKNGLRFGLRFPTLRKLRNISSLHMSHNQKEISSHFSSYKFKLNLFVLNRVPATALISVDLPALGTPTTHARSDRLPGRHISARSGSESSLLCASGSAWWMELEGTPAEPGECSTVPFRFSICASHFNF